MSRGIIIFGINNSEVDYVQLAIIAAAFIKANMPGTSVCLITNKESKHDYDKTGLYKISDYFSDVILVDDRAAESNTRAYKNTQHYKVHADFKNSSRSDVYVLSPYDETILIDSDYLICNDALSMLWGSIEEIRINRQARTLLHDSMHLNDTRLNRFGIPMYWATVIYFKKSDNVKQLFDLVQYIKENWAYYKVIYDFPGSMFRNDYAFSIAIHILNGYEETSDYFQPLIDDTLLTVTDIDQFYKIVDPKTLIFFVNDGDQSQKLYLNKTEGLNIHCMNKLSLLDKSAEIMEALNV